ncbi:MAG: hypothetical protein CMN31_12245 [Sandaracinus sp.]|nr:hypothetical protein [Myxococcales bacterium]MAT25514.1 hypothetical protein [Sandaracinus sp.]MBJ72091.1 hypothetical protein [Sandaracinus sp.]
MEPTMHEEPERSAHEHGGERGGGEQRAGERRGGEPNQGGALQRFVRDEEGGMFAEAVIVLPVFILVWSLIAFVNSGYNQALGAGTATRGAGWATVMGQCEDDPPAPTNSDNRGGLSLTGIAVVATVAMRAARIARYQPYILRYTTFLAFDQDEIEFSQAGDLDRPAAIGGSARYGHRIALVCDESEPAGTSLSLMILAAWRAIDPDI